MKNYILLCFKPNQLSKSGNVKWNNIISQRPVFQWAAKECEDNIRIFMNKFVNPDREMMKEKEINLFNGHINNHNILSMVDGKMAEILSGAGGHAANYALLLIQILWTTNSLIKDFP